MILVPLFDLKFLIELAACGAGTSGGTGRAGAGTRLRTRLRSRRAHPSSSIRHHVSVIVSRPLGHGFSCTTFMLGSRSRRLVCTPSTKATVFRSKRH